MITHIHKQSFESVTIIITLSDDIGCPAHFRHLCIQLKKMCLQFRSGHSGMCECSFQFRLWSIKFEKLTFNFVLCHPTVFVNCNSNSSVIARRFIVAEHRATNQFRLLAFIFVKVSLKIVAQIYAVML